MKVACLGQAGSFSQQAVIEYFGAAEIVACESFEAVFKSVAAGESDSAMLPIENSLVGSIHQNYDLLARHELFIAGEHLLRVRHCLIGLPGVTRNEITRVLSHPQALGQCAAYLRRLNATGEPAADTAGSVALVKAAGERNVAAIASRRAAEIYEMEILEEGIEDDPQNYTRFLVVARNPILPEGEAKTSIVFTLPNQAGTLYKAIDVFAQRGINVTKIETRPLAGRPWEHLFFLDFEGASHQTHVQEALMELGGSAPMLRVFGSYPRCKSSLDSSASPS